MTPEKPGPDTAPEGYEPAPDTLKRIEALERELQAAVAALEDLLRANKQSTYMKPEILEQEEIIKGIRSKLILLRLSQQPKRPKPLRVEINPRTGKVQKIN